MREKGLVVVYVFFAYAEDSIRPSIISKSRTNEGHRNTKERQAARKLSAAQTAALSGFQSVSVSCVRKREVLLLKTGSRPCHRLGIEF